MRDVHRVELKKCTLLLNTYGRLWVWGISKKCHALVKRTQAYCIHVAIIRVHACINTLLHTKRIKTIHYLIAHLKS